MRRRRRCARPRLEGRVQPFHAIDEVLERHYLLREDVLEGPQGGFGVVLWSLVKLGPYLREAGGGAAIGFLELLEVLLQRKALTAVAIASARGADDGDGQRRTNEYGNKPEHLSAQRGTGRHSGQPRSTSIALSVAMPSRSGQ